MYIIVVHAVTISIIFPTAGRTYQIVEHPSRLVVSLDGGLHIKYASKHITQITIKALDIVIIITDRHHILVRVRINKTGAELDELDIHCIVHTRCITTEVRTRTLDGTLLVVVVKTNIISIGRTATT